MDVRRFVADGYQAVSTDRRHQLVLFIGIPLALGIVMGGARAGMGRHLPTAWSVAYWVGSILLVWLSFELGSRLMERVLRPWRPPLWLILAMGAVLARLATEPLASAYVQAFMPLVPAAAAAASPPVDDSWVIVWVRHTLSASYLICIWIAANYYFWKMLGMPRFGIVPADSRARGAIAEASRSAQDASPAAAASPGASAVAGAGAGAAVRDALPLFVARLCPQIGPVVVAIEAEDHFVKVHGVHASALVSYRFSDALREVGHLDGLQVHRSFWVNRSQIRRLRNAGRTVSLDLANGLTVPVSHAYRELVRRSLPG